MYLQQILNGIECKVIGEGNPQIENLCCDTSKVKPNSLFFCLEGTKHDGHNFFRKAIGDGAVAIVCQHPLDTKVLQIVVQDSREAMSLAAKNFFDGCVDKMRVIGIVGTNGKTTTSVVLDNILNKAGINTALIGTNGVFFNGIKHPSLLTTPDPIELHALFKEMYLNKISVVIMEVSAHAIALKKVQGINFELAIFTNCTQDHLDFFGTMQRYRETKSGFFCQEYVKNAIVNIDDALGFKISSQLPCVTVSSKQQADCYASDVQVLSQQSNYVVNAFGQKAVVNTKLAGAFNVQNTLCALATALTMGVGIDCAVKGIEEVAFVNGRNQTIMRNDGARIVIDFAHTPDGVKNILGYLKSTTKGQLIVVFGCGGNRDKIKRPIMGQSVSLFADFAILTNDNPRFEDPKIIAQEVTDGLTCNYKIILNRSQATEYALSIAKTGDTVAILGKGAETFQEIRGKKIPYCDIDIVNYLLHN